MNTLPDGWSSAAEALLQHVAQDMARALPTTKKDGQPIGTIGEINLYAVAKIGGLKDPMVAQIWEILC